MCQLGLLIWYYMCIIGWRLLLERKHFHASIVVEELDENLCK